MDIKLAYKQVALDEGIPDEVYNKTPEKWNDVVITLHLIKFILDHKSQNTTNNIVDDLQVHQNALCDLIRRALGSYMKLHQTLVQVETVILSWPQGSGGHFLKNCLCFSDDFLCFGAKTEYYMDNIVLNKLICDFTEIKNPTDVIKLHNLHKIKSLLTLSEFNTLEEKVNYIILETKSQIYNWTDPNIVANNKSPKINPYNIYLTHLPLSQIVNGDLKFFANCKTIIFFKNASSFCNLRSYSNWTPYYNTINHCTQKTLLEFIELSQKNKSFIMNKFNDEIQIYSYCDLISKITVYIWDTNWFFSEKNTITHIKELYEILHLSGFDENSISKYYNTWIKTMSDLKTKSLNMYEVT